MEVLLPCRRRVPRLGELAERAAVRPESRLVSQAEKLSPAGGAALLEAMQRRHCVDQSSLDKILLLPIPQWTARGIFAEANLFRRASRAWGSSLVVLDVWAVDTTRAELKSLFESARKLRRVKMALISALDSDSGVAEMLEPVAVQLQHLSMGSIACVGDAVLNLLAESAANLSALELDQVHATSSAGFVELMKKRGVQLEELCVNNCSGMSNVALKALATAGCSKLRRLELSDADVSDSGVERVLKQCATRLVSLNLSGTSISCESLEVLSACDKVPLRELKLDRLFNVTANAISEVAMTAEGLEVLWMQDNDEVDDELMETLVMCCTRLRDLGISGCSEVTDQGVAALLAELEHLERLDVRNGPKLSIRIRQVIFQKVEAMEVLI